jgi:hypothetical protein
VATHQSTLRQKASIDKAMIDIHFYFDFISPHTWIESADWLDVGKLPVGIRRTPASK